MSLSDVKIKSSKLGPFLDSDIGKDYISSNMYIKKNMPLSNFHRSFY